jgi:hypothetical protein
MRSERIGGEGLRLLNQRRLVARWQGIEFFGSRWGDD